MKKLPISKHKFAIEKFSSDAVKNTWEEIKVVIDDIYNKNISHHRYEVVYRQAYNLVIQQHGDMLYREVVVCIEEHLRKYNTELNSSSSDTFLKFLSSVWNDHNLNVNNIKQIILYAENNYVPKFKTKAITELALQSFRRIIIEDSEIMNQLRLSLMNLTDEERRGAIVETSEIKAVLKMLLDIDAKQVQSPGTPLYYESIFEIGYLENARRYYRNFAQKLLEVDSCADCLRKIENAMKWESLRKEIYLPGITYQKLSNILEEELISNCTSLLLLKSDSTGLENSLRGDLFAELSLFYKLLSVKPDSLDALRCRFFDLARSLGLEITTQRSQDKVKESTMIEENKDPYTCVELLIKYRTKIQSIVKRCFNNDSKFQLKSKQLFDELVNAETICIANSLSIFLDQQQRENFRKHSDAEVEDILDDAVALFRHIQEKDVFEHYYKNHFAKRLLNQKSFSEEYERLFLSKLKAECGYHYTSKLEGMVKDMAISKSIAESYSNYLRGKENEISDKIDHDFTVLTCGYWPTQKYDDDYLVESLPTGLRNNIDSFNSFYKLKHEGRRLHWNFSLGSAEVKFFSQNGDFKHDFAVTLIQAIILSLFNHTEKNIDFARILQVLKIPDAEVKRHLLSLCTPKLRILKKSSQCRGIDEDEHFAINEDFNSKFRRIKVPLLASLPGSAPDKEGTLNVPISALNASVPNEIHEERKHTVDAAIVRVMKARKHLSHTELLAEVTKQLLTRFILPPQLLKQRVESLIEREFLERDKGVRNTYNYLA